MSIFNELNRRNVFRVGIAYIVAAWVLLQVADLVLGNINAPDWIIQVMMLVVALGFLVSVVIAWAYEITPEGIKREAEVDREKSISRLTGKKLDRVIILFLVLAVAVLLFERFTSPVPEPVESTRLELREEVETMDSIQATPVEPSIAVLPFVNMSAESDQEYFSDGISEELLNLLVRVEGLKVASRTSSFTYKGENQNIPEIARELKVDHILEGSVRKAGNRVRITAQLIDVTTDRHLWSDTFDRELVDIFAIQDEIANAIVNALKTELGIGLQAVSVETATENLDAYDLYLKARGLFIARQNLDVSIRLFEKATQLDPGFALAWEGLAAAHNVGNSWLAGDGIDHVSLAHEAALKALEVDPNLSMAYAVLADRPEARKDYLQKIEYYDIAIANDPKNATAWLWRGIDHKDTGHFDRAIHDFEQCLAIDPAYLNCKQHMAQTYLFQGEEEIAIRLFEETLEENFHSIDDAFVAHYVHSGQRLTAILLASSTIFGPYAPVKDWISAIENPDQNHSARIARWRRFAKSQNYDVCGFGAVIVALRLDDCYDSQLDSAFENIWHKDADYYRKTQAFKDQVNEYLMSYWLKHGFPSQCHPLDDGDFECE